MIKAVIFDMDGVIVDSEPYWEESTWEYVEKKCGTTHLRKFQERDLNMEVRGRTQPFIAAYLKKHLDLPDSSQRIIDDRLRILFKIFDKKLRLEPGAISLLNMLRKNRYPIILASSSPRRVVNYIIKRFGLKKYFRKTISGDDMKFSKPHPWIYYRSAKILRIKPPEMAVIEDSISGIMSGLKSGAKVIAIKKPYTPKKYTKKAVKVIKSLKHLKLEHIEHI